MTKNMPPYTVLYLLGLTAMAGVWCIGHSLIGVISVVGGSLGYIVMLGLTAVFMDWWTSWERSYRLNPRAVLTVGGTIGALALLLAIPAQSFTLLVSSPDGWHATLLSGSTIGYGFFYALTMSIPAFVIALGIGATQYSKAARSRARRLAAR